MYIKFVYHYTTQKEQWAVSFTYSLSFRRTNKYANFDDVLLIIAETYPFSRSPFDCGCWNNWTDLDNLFGKCWMFWNIVSIENRLIYCTTSNQNHSISFELWDVYLMSCNKNKQFSPTLAGEPTFPSQWNMLLEKISLFFFLWFFFLKKMCLHPIWSHLESSKFTIFNQLFVVSFSFLFTHWFIIFPHLCRLLVSIGAAATKAFCCCCFNRCWCR